MSLLTERVMLSISCADSKTSRLKCACSWRDIPTVCRKLTLRQKPLRGSHETPARDRIGHPLIVDRVLPGRRLTRTPRRNTHIAWYNNIGRTEVLPVPGDPNARVTGIRYRFSMGRIIDPPTSHGQWLTRIRYIDSRSEVDAWYFARFKDAHDVVGWRAGSRMDGTSANRSDQTKRIFSHRPTATRRGGSCS